MGKIKPAQRGGKKRPPGFRGRLGVKTLMELNSLSLCQGAARSDRGEAKMVGSFGLATQQPEASPDRPLEFSPG